MTTLQSKEDIYGLYFAYHMFSNPIHIYMCVIVVPLPKQTLIIK